MSSPDAGRNVLSIGPTNGFDWSEICGVWTSGYNDGIYAEYCASTLYEDIALDDDMKYVHFLLCLPSNYGISPILYVNINGVLHTYTGQLSGSVINYSYIGNAEGVNHFAGTIRKLNVFNYMPSASEAREILGIPETEAYSTITINSNMMEVGSLSNIAGQLGTEVDWSEEIRTDDYITLPIDVLEVSLGSYYDTDRIYFYDANHTGIAEFTVTYVNERVAIPSGAVYMKFLLKTPVLTNIDVTYYK